MCSHWQPPSATVKRTPQTGALKRSRALSAMASATMWTVFGDTLKRSRRLGGRLRRGGHAEISDLRDHPLKSFAR